MSFPTFFHIGVWIFKLDDKLLRIEHAREKAYLQEIAYKNLLFSLREGSGFSLLATLTGLAGIALAIWVFVEKLLPGGGPKIWIWMLPFVAFILIGVRGLEGCRYKTANLTLASKRNGQPLNFHFINPGPRLKTFVDILSERMNAEEENPPEPRGLRR
jgi:hypothetical protein